MLTFSKRGKSANLLSLVLIFTIASQPAFGLECWECDSRDIDPTNWKTCGGFHQTNGESKPCDIPNGMCVAECHIGVEGNSWAGNFNRQFCTNDTSFVTGPGQCERKQIEVGPNHLDRAYMCACDTDNCNNNKYTCNGERYFWFPTERPQLVT